MTGPGRDGANPAPAPSLWLRSRLVVVAAGLLAAVLAVAALAFLVYERGVLQAAALDRSELFARVLEDQANRTLNGLEVVLGASAEALRREPNRPGDKLSPSDVRRPVSPLQATLRALPYLRSISLVDAEGRVLASSNPANVGRQLARQRLLAAGASAGLGPLQPGRDLADLDAAIDPAVGAAPPSLTAGLTGASLLPLVRPLDSTPQSDWLVAAINPDYFANQYRLLLGDTPQRAALLAYDGQLIAASEGISLPAGGRVPGHRIFSQFLPGREQGSFIGPGLDGQTTYSAFRSARALPLVVLVETPGSAVADQAQGGALKVAAGLGVVLAVVVVLGSLAWRSLRVREQVSGDLAAARGSLAAQDVFTDRLFQVSPMPMVVKDSDGRFVRVNQAWSDLTGFAPERVIGVSLGRLYPAHLAAPHEVQEQMALASGLPMNYEEQILDADGLPRDVMIRVMPYTDAAGLPVGVISCLTDVSEFREAAQRTLEGLQAAERANAAKTEFLTNISHELRTPLQSILGFSELGGLRSRSEVRLQGMFGDIHRAGQRMLLLVNNLLDLSRLESTVGEVVLRPIDINPGLRAVVAELWQLAQARGLRLVVLAEEAKEGEETTGFDGDRPAAAGLWANADEFRLQQVLRNVLANAIRFAPEGSEISLRWQHDGLDELSVQVRDHGPGIPADEIDSIFESFVQSSRTKDGSGGTGLGLAICRKIMAAHHGYIRARNHSAGGAVFEFRLPALAAPGAASGQRWAAPSSLDTLPAHTLKGRLR